MSDLETERALLNTDLLSSLLYILDNEAPQFVMCVFNQTLNTQPRQSFTVAVWQHPSATDNSGDVPEVICNPLSGSEFTIGKTLVTCEAVDRHGNNNTCGFQIDVRGTSFIRYF